MWILFCTICACRQSGAHVAERVGSKPPPLQEQDLGSHNTFTLPHSPHFNLLSPHFSSPHAISLTQHNTFSPAHTSPTSLYHPLPHFTSLCYLNLLAQHSHTCIHLIRLTLCFLPHIAAHLFRPPHPHTQDNSHVSLHVHHNASFTAYKDYFRCILIFIKRGDTSYVF